VDTRSRDRFDEEQHEEINKKSHANDVVSSTIRVPFCLPIKYNSEETISLSMNGISKPQNNVARCFSRRN
jgi:hypothetical protein